jgi:hypothetical protein
LLFALDQVNRNFLPNLFQPISSAVDDQLRSPTEQYRMFRLLTLQTEIEKVASLPFSFALCFFL